MAITWNQPVQPVATKSGGGIKWNNPQPTLPEGQTALQSAQGALGHSQGIMDSIGNFASGIMPGIAKSGASALMQAGAQHAGPIGAAMSANAPEWSQAMQAGEQAMQPQGAGEQVGHAIGEVGQFLGAGGLDLIKGGIAGVKALPSLYDAVKAEGVGGLVSKGFSGARNLVQDFAAKRADKAATQSSIDALSPKLEGKKLVNAYKSTVSTDRTVTSASIFHEQGLTPDQKTINLSKRLKDLGLGKDSVKNLDTLGKNMTDTEKQLRGALSKDPEIVYNGDRENLVRKLNDVRNTAPEEFRIKDSQAMVDRVVNFANRIAASSEDSIVGLRDARTAFDTQAKTEFPNAFKGDEGIDTKTPAGYAIKAVRDAMNEHLYHTAPNGSEIQRLIGREADLFRASDVVGPKASESHDKRLIQLLIEKHPELSRYIGWGLGGVGADTILKKTTGVGF